MLLLIILFSLINSYPCWFLRMPVKEGVLFAVGYAPKYYYLSNSFKEARIKLKEAILKSIKARVKGKVVSWVECGVSLYGRDFKITPLGDTSFKPAVIDSAITENMVIVLGATRKVKNWRNTLFEIQGEWWKSTPQREGWLYSVGTAPLYFYENRSWEEAEEDALYNLAKQICQYVYVEELKTGEISGKFGLYKVNVQLSDAQVLARHVSKEMGVVYVLVGMPMSTDE